jgi:hypothetical protein
MDFVVVGLLVLAFAWLVTMHVAITVGLAQRRPRWRALVGLVVVPFAPYWAWRERMRTRVWLWGASAVLYLIALGLAFR